MLLSFSCNNCGAALEAPEKTNFITCNYCKSRLAVKCSTSAVYTEVIEEIREKVTDIHEDVEVIRLQNELERIDREWELEKTDYMVRTKAGHLVLPSLGFGAVVPGALAIIGGLILLGLFNGTESHSFGGPPLLFRLFPLTFVIIGICTIIGGLSGKVKHGQYQVALQRYQTRRQQVVVELRKLKAYQ